MHVHWGFDTPLTEVQTTCYWLIVNATEGRDRALRVLGQGFLWFETTEGYCEPLLATASH